MVRAMWFWLLQVGASGQTKELCGIHLKNRGVEHEGYRTEDFIF